MNIDQLQTLLNRLKEAGVPGNTPVVVAHGDEDEDTVSLTELDEHCILENVQYQISSEKMAAIRRNGSPLVLSSADCPAYQNTTAFKVTNSANVVHHEINFKARDGVDVTDQYVLGDIIDMSDTVRVSTEVWNRTKRSADRWDAMMSAPAIRILGCAGLREHSTGLSDDYAHFGMEIWTHHSGSYDNVTNGGIIERFADKMIDNNSRIDTMKVTLPDNIEWGRVPTRADFIGEQTHMGLRDKSLVTLLNEEGYITVETAKAAAIKQGITRDVELQVSYSNDTIKLIIEDCEETDDRFIVTGKFVCDGKEVEFTNEAFDAYNRFGRRDDRDPDIARLTEEAKVAGLYGVVRVVPVYASVGE